jgi:hypothetical protein
MANKNELHQLIGRLLGDPKLYRKAQTDPVAAAKEAGVQLTPDQEKWLASKPPQLQKTLQIASGAYATSPGEKSAEGENCGTCIVDGH